MSASWHDDAVQKREESIPSFDGEDAVLVDYQDYH
jgi:hypothetical protein